MQLPAEVAASLQRNAEALDGIVVEWRMERASARPSSRLLEQIGYDIGFLEPVEAAFAGRAALFHVRFRHRIAVFDKEHRFQSLAVVNQDVSFDGANFYVGTPSGERHKGILIIDPIERAVAETPDAAFLRSDYFRQAGFKVAEIPREVGAGPRSLVLYLRDEGAKVLQVEQEQVDGIPCLRLNLRGAGRLWVFHLDLSQGYAVRRREERTPAGKVQCVAVVSDFVDLAGTEGVSLPRRCEVTYYQWRGKPDPPEDKPLFQETYTVSHLSRDPVPDDRFIVMYTNPGASIADGTFPEAGKSPTGRIEYVVPANPEDLDKVIQHAIDGTPFIPRDVQERRRRFALFWAISLAVLTGVAAALWVRARKAKLRAKDADSAAAD